MTVTELVGAAGYRVYTRGEDRTVEHGYCGDFLSNVISRAPASCAWLTVMNNVNVAAVSTLIDCACIVLCEGVGPDAALAARAETLGIWLLGTDADVFGAAKQISALCGI